MGLFEFLIGTLFGVIFIAFLISSSLYAELRIEEGIEIANLCFEKGMVAELKDSEFYCNDNGILYEIKEIDEEYLVRIGNGYVK